jgi:hypothetical protein
VPRKKVVESITPPAKEATVPTSLHLARSQHFRLKTAANVKGVSMADIVAVGIDLALADPRFKLTDSERKELFG